MPICFYQFRLRGYGEREETLPVKLKKKEEVVEEMEGVKVEQELDHPDIALSQIVISKSLGN